MTKSVKILITCLALGLSMALSAQEPEKFPDGMYIVGSSGRYGVQDENGNVILSAEYDSLDFRNGLAILTKGDRVYGHISETGEIRMFEQSYFYNKRYPFYSEGYLVVGRPSLFSQTKVQWLYIDEYGKPLEGRIKFFGYAEPFFFGYAVVRDYVHIGTGVGKLRHIDMSCNERFIIEGEEVIHRSAVYWGGSETDRSECVIITDSGIHLCQENGDLAVVKKTLYSGNTIEKYENPYSFGDSSGGVLLFNGNGQAEVYAPQGEPLQWLIPVVK